MPEGQLGVQAPARTVLPAPQPPIHPLPVCCPAHTLHLDSRTTCCRSWGVFTVRVASSLSLPFPPPLSLSTAWETT